ncbi:MAG: glycosyltransferase family 2 protein [Pseudomonadaceae bacterium]|nr:glycosyltransferase family 2 protein [Pseudomonadaceae bacterium]
MLALTVLAIAIALMAVSIVPASSRLTSSTDASPDSKVTALLVQTEACTLETTLRRLTEQTPVSEILVVGDTPLPEWALASDNIHLLHGTTAPTGWSARRWRQQQALRQASGTWLLLIDSDIELVPGTVSAAIDECRRNELDFLSLTPAPAGHPNKLNNSAGLMLLLTRFGQLLRRPFDRSRELTTATLLIRAETLAALSGVERVAAKATDDRALARALHAQGVNGDTRWSHCARRHHPVNTSNRWPELRAPAALAGVLLGLLIAAAVWLIWAFEPRSLEGIAGIATIAALTSAHFWPLSYYNQHPIALPLQPLLLFLVLASNGFRWLSERFGRGHTAALPTGVES